MIDYFTSDNKEHWLEEIKKSDWGAGQYLYELLRSIAEIVVLENFWNMLMYWQRWKDTSTYIFPQERLAFMKSMAISLGK